MLGTYGGQDTALQPCWSGQALVNHRHQCLRVRLPGEDHSTEGRAKVGPPRSSEG